jgi:hypothetical protein
MLSNTQIYKYVYSFMNLLIVTRPVSQIEQELITLVEYYNLPVVLCRVPVARSLVFCVHNRNHKLKNMQSTTRCIPHKQVLLECCQIHKYIN